jgi:hypothetical protein
VAHLCSVYTSSVLITSWNHFTGRESIYCVLRLCRVPNTLPDFNQNLKFLGRFSLSPQSNFMQIRPVGATLIRVDNRQLDKATNSLILFQLNRVLLWQFNVPGNNKTYLDLWSAWCFCLTLTKFEFLWQTFIKAPNIKCHGNPSIGSCTHTCDRWTDMTKVRCFMCLCEQA